MMDVTELAKTTALSLTPALPYLLQGGEQVVGGTLKKIGADTWDLAKNIWKGLTSRGDSSAEGLKQAAVDAVDHPSDEHAQSALIFQIKKLLESDLELCAEIKQALDTASAGQMNIHSGGVHIEGSVLSNSGNIVGGNQTIGKMEEEE